MSIDINEAITRLLEMDRRAAAHPEDGDIYEDEFVSVRRVNGQVEMRGKPLRCPFMYIDGV